MKHQSPASRKTLAITLAGALALALAAPTGMAMANGTARAACVTGTSTISECLPDTALAQVVASANSTTPSSVLTQTMVDHTATLWAYGKGIRSLEGIGVLSNLTDLELPDNMVSDLTPLTALTRLQKLNLDSYTLGLNPVTDIRPLASIPSLQELSINRTDHSIPGRHTDGITDISPLHGMTGLKKLYIEGNGITDISPLHGIIDRIDKIYVGLYSQHVNLPTSQATSSTSTSIRTAKCVDGSYITPTASPTDGASYNPATGMMTWTGQTPGSTVTLFYSTPVQCACGNETFDGQITQTLPEHDPTPPSHPSTDPVTDPNSPSNPTDPSHNNPSTPPTNPGTTPTTPPSTLPTHPANPGTTPGTNPSDPSHNTGDHNTVNQPPTHPATTPGKPVPAQPAKPAPTGSHDTAKQPGTQAKKPQAKPKTAAPAAKPAAKQENAAKQDATPKTQTVPQTKPQTLAQTGIAIGMIPIVIAVLVSMALIIQTQRARKQE